MNDERRTSRRLRTTMSAHHVVFPSFSSSVWLYYDFSSSLSCVSVSFSAVISHPSLSSSLYVSFSPLSVTLLSSLLPVSSGVSLQLCSFALVLPITLFSLC